MEGRPSVIRYDSDAAQRLESRRRLEGIDSNRLMNSRNFECLTIINRLHLPAQNRRVFDGGIKHTVEENIHPVYGLTGTEVGEVIAGHSFADVAPFVLRLKLHVLFAGNWEFRCC